MIELAGDAIANGEPVAVDMDVRTENRTVGARVANAITVRHPCGLPEDTVSIRLTGSAGQSFGAFIVDGMRLDLEGEANDYVGKGMSGGEIAIRPPARCAVRPPRRPSPATPSSTARPAAACSPPAAPASASASATAAPRRSSRGSATTAAST